MAWYLAYTHPRAETKARWHLENQGFTAYVPSYMKQCRHARRTDSVKAPLFPRYLFVWMDIAKAPWRVIHSTIGIHHLICGGEIPLEVPERIIQELREREDEKGLIKPTHPAYKRGDKVRVTAGALIEQIGIFECSSDDERAVILLNFLQRDVHVRVPLELLCRYA